MHQLGFFDGTQPLKIEKPIRLIELFGGIGSQAKALSRLNANFEHYRLCEFDEYAVTSYNAIHGTEFEKSDICEWKGSDLGICETNKFTYLLTYSFPCQDVSLAGLKKGMGEGTGTRSALLWQVKRLLEESEELPQILVMENVPQVVGSGNINHFMKWVEFLEKLGYKSKWEILNAKDFKVPQNRERCFMVSWLGDYYYDFPTIQPLEKVLRDILLPEDEVDNKYYLSTKNIKFLNKPFSINRNGFNIEGQFNTSYEAASFIYGIDGLSPTLTARDYKGAKCIHIAQLQGKFEMPNRVYSPNGLSPAISPIRKLTPKECWRLMDFDDSDYENARNALNKKHYGGKDRSASQLYKQAGNSIVVNVLVEIFRKML